MENVNLIRSIAWSFHQTTGIDYEELFSEATLAYYESLPKYDSNIAAISTYMHKCIKNALMQFVYTEYNKPRSFSQMPENIDFVKEKTEDEFFELILSLPEACRSIIEEVLQNENLYTGESLHFKRKDKITPRMARGMLYRNLRKKGWSWPKIWRNIKYIKCFLNKHQTSYIIYQTT